MLLTKRTSTLPIIFFQLSVTNLVFVSTLGNTLMIFGRIFLLSLLSEIWYIYIFFFFLENVLSTLWTWNILIILNWIRIGWDSVSHKRRQLCLAVLLLQLSPFYDFFFLVQAVLFGRFWQYLVYVESLFHIQEWKHSLTTFLVISP